MYIYNSDQIEELKQLLRESLGVLAPPDTECYLECPCDTVITCPVNKAKLYKYKVERALIKKEFYYEENEQRTSSIS